MHRRIVPAAFAVAGLLVAGAPAQADQAPVSDPHVLVHLDLAAGQQPENIALEPDGTADLDFAYTGQLATVSRGGRVRNLAQIPVPADGDVPVVHRRIFLGGLVRTVDGNRYVAVSTGRADSTGVYRFRPGRTPTRIAALPPSGFHNGMAVDYRTGSLYVADSFAATVWRIPLHGGPATAWASGPTLAPTSGFGANGLKVHDGAVWVSNLDRQSLVRIPIGADGTAGSPRVMADRLGPIDDFAFTGAGDTVLAAINQENRVILVGGGAARTVLTAADGLSNPTSVAVRGDTGYITDAGYFTQRDPNVLTVHLGH